MTEFDSWESYFYPETIHPETGSGTLRNHFGVRDWNRLRQLEYVATAARAADLRQGRASVPHTYDASHVRAIHAHLFQDVYEWAGQYRTVDMAKGPRGFFAQVEGRSSELHEALSGMRMAVRLGEWDSGNKETFVQDVSEVFAWYNHAHPFREGNGRTGKQFLHDVAERTPFELDFSRISSEVWNAQSDLSRPPREGQEPNPEALYAVFDAVTIR